MEADADRHALADRIDALAEELGALSRRVAGLEARLEAGAVAPPAAQEPDPARIEAAESPAEPPPWGTTTTLLSRSAFVCLLLVAALILRTLSESGVIGVQVGSLLGIGYAAALMAASGLLYGRRSPLAPILAVSGTALLCTVVLETNARLGVVSTPTGYGLLILAGAAMAGVNLRHDVALPGCVATAAVVVSGLLLGLPGPNIQFLALLVLVSNATAYAVARRPGYGWLRIFVLLATVAVWATWARELRYDFLAGRGSPASLPWFLPLLFATAAVYLASAYRGASQPGAKRIGVLDAALPSVTVMWAFPAALEAVGSPRGPSASFGLAGGFASLAYFALALQLSRGGKPGTPGTGAFAFGGALLLAVSLPLALDNPLLALSLLSGAALGLGILSGRWESGAVRLTAYLLQAYVSAAAAVSISLPDDPGLQVFLTAAVSGIAFGHYRWARTHPPPGPSAFFSRADPTDRTAVVLLLSTLVAGFLALLPGVHRLVQAVSTDPENAFGCAQSILLNGSALALILAAYRSRSTEIRAVAILVLALGAAKVFLIDLFAARGIPLVLSVSSFGAAAALGSLVLRRWQRCEPA
ncbi:MAG: DUF2339 domain-containing protein [Deltaproteobacteria bacterium]|nr:DUF2339 domain-containing protein [Deltaproteobacteria bacterium]